ncbi:MAG: hypothetical protein AAF700_13530 [Pseudomonadota bacterium]
MTVTSTLRIVGLYGLLSNKKLEGVEPSSTVEVFMDEFEKQNDEFYYKSADGLVDTIAYTYKEGQSENPPNAMNATSGFREESTVIGGAKDVIWQYYRSVKATYDGTVYEFKIPTKGQPPFSTQPFDGMPDGSAFVLPAGFENPVYILTWRLITVEVVGTSRKRFILSKAKVLESA